ncbi:aldehyde dehydrogenase family protein [Streptomyces sp. TR1341]|uniref:aldehyde dehydrogenase family protein n=1 Tax=Streptomyces sp. TR1341 TaxID=2601266 RepID=UPI00138ABB22|nr:aldehyde dehydrogenase family protein [Streptomyces sp. TR1341]
MRTLPVLRPAGPYRSDDRGLLRAVSGAPLAEVGEAPPLLVRRTLEQQRRARVEADGRPRALGEERLRTLRIAGELFLTATLDGERPEDYVRVQSLATGLPEAAVRRAMTQLRDQLAGLGPALGAQRPSGAGPDSPRAKWVRRASLLGVIAPSNHPATHGAWVQALALGYQIAVRPGGRDPFTPLRLVRALVQAGLGPAEATVLPGSHAAADTLVDTADLALVYGGESTVARYRDTSRVLVRGPGRTKALLLGTDQDDAVLDHLVQEVSDDGGVRCTNLTTVFTTGDHAALADALASRLAKLPVLPAADPDAVLPLRHISEATALHAAVQAHARDAVDVSAAHHGADPHPLVQEEAAAMRPIVLRCDSPTHPGTAVEMPYPCVWVAPWRPEDGTGPLGDSLALHLLDRDDGPAAEWLAALLRDAPTVRTLLRGPHHRWWRDPLLPHDGYLGQFLMEARGLVDTTEGTR